MSATPPNPAGAPVPTPVAPAGSNLVGRAVVGKTPYCPSDLPKPWYAGVWDRAQDDWTVEPAWFETWPEAYAHAVGLHHFPLWAAELRA
ncbi:hypothetical protein [Promicromonospora sp. NPDC050262]|uniref:hypothetical protein n=1 Tax=Promicromonospora sp. NPDC050262 TaxID=3155036 RepID=UPI0033CA1BCA